VNVDLQRDSDIKSGQGFGLHQRFSSRNSLSPVHTSNNVEATLSNATSWTILSDSVECCFDIVAGVDGALDILECRIVYVTLPPCTCYVLPASPARLAVSLTLTWHLVHRESHASHCTCS